MNPVHSPSSSPPTPPPESGFFLWRLITKAGNFLKNNLIILAHTITEIWHNQRASQDPNREASMTNRNVSVSQDKLGVSTPFSSSPASSVAGDRSYEELDLGPFSPYTPPYSDVGSDSDEEESFNTRHLQKIKALLEKRHQEKIKLGSPLTPVLPSRQLNNSLSAQPLPPSPHSVETPFANELEANTSNYILKVLEDTISHQLEAPSLKKLASVLEETTSQFLHSGINVQQINVSIHQLLEAIKDMKEEFSKNNENTTGTSLEEPGEDFQEASEYAVPSFLNQNNQQEILAIFHQNAKEGLTPVLGEERSQEILDDPDAYIYHLNTLFKDTPSEATSEIYKKLFTYFLQNKSGSLDLSTDPDLSLTLRCFQKLEKALFLEAMERDVQVLKNQIRANTETHHEGFIRETLKDTLLENAKAAIPSLIHSFSQMVSSYFQNPFSYTHFFDTTLIKSLNEFIHTIHAKKLNPDHGAFSNHISAISSRISKKITANAFHLFQLNPQKLTGAALQFKLNEDTERLMKNIDKIIFDLKKLYPGIPIEFPDGSKAVIKQTIRNLILNPLKNGKETESLEKTLKNILETNLPKLEARIQQAIQKVLETTLSKNSMDRLFATSIFPKVTHLLLDKHIDSFLEPSNIDTVAKWVSLKNVKYNPSLEFFNALNISSEEDLTVAVEAHLRKKMEHALETSGISREEAPSLFAQSSLKAHAAAEHFQLDTYMDSCLIAIRNSAKFATALEESRHNHPQDRLEDLILPLLQKQFSTLLPKPPLQPFLSGSIQLRTQAMSTAFARQIEDLAPLSINESLGKLKEKTVNLEKKEEYYHLLSNFLEKVGEFKLSSIPFAKHFLQDSVASSLNEYRSNPNSLLNQLSSVMKNKKTELILLNKSKEIQNIMRNFSVEKENNASSISDFINQIHTLKVSLKEEEEITVLCDNLLDKALAIQEYIDGKESSLNREEILEYIKEIKNIFQVDEISLNFTELGALKSELERAIQNQSEDIFQDVDLEVLQTREAQYKENIEYCNNQLSKTKGSAKDLREIRALRDELVEALNDPEIKIIAQARELQQKIEREKEEIEIKTRALQEKELKITALTQNDVNIEIKKIAQLSFSFLNHSLSTSVGSTALAAAHFFSPLVLSQQLLSVKGIEAITQKIYENISQNNVATALLVENLVEAFSKESLENMEA